MRKETPLMNWWYFRKPILRTLRSEFWSISRFRNCKKADLIYWIQAIWKLIFPSCILDNNETEDQPEEDGVLMYLAIKVKEEFKNEPQQEQMRKLFRNDFNNNPGTIQKKVKRKISKMVQNEKGEMVEIEVSVNKRKVTRNIIDEKGRVMEVETEVTTEDSDEDIVNEDGTITKSKSKKKMRRGRTGGQGRRDSQEADGEPQRRRKSTIRRRKLTQEEIQQG